MSDSRKAGMEREEEEKAKVYKKANVPILGTYKQYSKKNTNAGLDWSYVQMSPDFTLYYAKQELVGIVLQGKGVVSNLPYTIRDRYTLHQSIENHMMRVIASKHNIAIEDDYEMKLCKKYWLLPHNWLSANHMPYLMLEALSNNGEMTKEMVSMIANLKREQMA